MLIITLTACQRNNVDYDDYLERLERVLQSERNDVQLQLPSKPQRHQFELPTPTHYGLYESFALKPCGVMTLIGEHNAQLGKTAPPSQQLIYHHQLGHLLQLCDLKQLDDAGIKLRQQVLSDKRRSLPTYSARLMLLSDEIWHNLDASSYPAHSISSEFIQTLYGLVELKAIFSDPERSMSVPSRHLEQALATLHHQRQPRKLHRAMVNAIDGLNQATQMLAAAKPTLCGKPEFTILNNVLHQIYAKRIQPKLVEIQRADRQVNEALQRLLSPWPDLPYFHFYLSNEPTSLRGQFQLAIDRHSQSWQQLLGQCGALPNGQNYAMSSSW
ncbi:DUF3080 family protein [Ferrimonas lipolytica]|uniref:DUF3080 domain-containing protein n=1 Tax=Ferrimonas lipolytica TaxID=2724191 RepID=A0A6H1UFE1_9GAMM|nr:DUF3080 family protein [Ferrimonas lipolytica]QIZ76512.1 DUF3080 domain-containing protein [Ferrimonas lipolytica]